AVLATASRAENANGLTIEEWALLQQLAHDWLRAELHAYAPLVEKGDKAAQQVVQRLTRWQNDWLAAMPAADRAPWQPLWADVAALLHKARNGDESYFPAEVRDAKEAVEAKEAVVEVPRKPRKPWWKFW